MVFDGSGTNFNVFWWLGERLEILCFSMAFQVGPELRDHVWLMVLGCFLSPIAATRRYGVAFQHVKYNINHAGTEKTTMQITEIRKIKAAI